MCLLAIRLGKNGGHLFAIPAWASCRKALVEDQGALSTVFTAELGMVSGSPALQMRTHRHAPAQECGSIRVNAR